MVKVIVRAEIQVFRTPHTPAEPHDGFKGLQEATAGLWSKGFLFRAADVRHCSSVGKPITDNVNAPEKPTPSMTSSSLWGSFEFQRETGNRVSC
jgi:hypothetical protein